MIGIILFLLAYLIWGLSPIFWKQLQAVDPIYILMTRIFYSMVLCFIILVIRGRFKEIKKVFRDRALMKKLAMASVVITVNWGFYIVAVSTGHILDGSLAFYMNPIFTIMISGLFFKEYIAKAEWLATFIALAGVLISIFAYGSIPYYAIVIGISFAIYGGFKKGIDLDTIMAVFVETLLMTPLALAYIIYGESVGIGALGNLHGLEFVLLPLSGVITATPLILYGMGIHATSLSLAGILMYINPTLQLLVGVFLYEEAFTKVNAITFGFVWVAVFIFVGYRFMLRGKKNREEL